jgi:putative phosphoesterase
MPERLALFGDVHGNGPALRAVLDAMAGAGLDRGACTGDLVMRGPDPEACVTAVRELGWPCVMGNTDRKVAGRPRRDPLSAEAARIGSRAWTTRQLSPENVHYLAWLPMVVRLQLAGRTIVVVHGAPDDPRRAIDEDTSDRDLRRFRDELDGPDCVVSGHTHAPFQRESAGCLFVNPGSVGEALDGDRHPRWAWLEARRSGLRAHLERLPLELAKVRSP